VSAGARHRLFSEADVLAIRELGRRREELERALAAVNLRAVARQYGTTKQTIHRIQVGDSYAHLGGPLAELRDVDSGCDHSVPHHGCASCDTWRARPAREPASDRR